jgi:hypothetical protein
MKKIFFFIVLATTLQLNVKAQFVESGEIEFEMPTKVSDRVFCLRGIEMPTKVSDRVF